VIVLVHAGVADARMWDGFDLPGAIRHELRGFGQTPLPPAGEFSHADDLEQALKGEPAALVGASYGGWVCLQVAAAKPDLVTDLVLLDAAVPDHEWSAEIQNFGNQEDALLEQGDLRGAAVLNADFWLEREEPRQRLIEMQERAFEHAKPDFHAIADRLSAGIAGARKAVVAGAGHLPTLERPEATLRLVRDFLAG
jgi:3-oxoadipate enol-lactonase